MSSLKTKILSYYEKNEIKVDIAFFLGGFVFDVFTLADIDDPLSIIQQLFYLLVTGSILYLEFLVPAGLAKVPARFEKFWRYRQLAFHFLLGSLLSVYSLFYLKSSSFFSSIVFVLLLLAIMVANELKRIQEGEVDLKMSLFVVCVFSFYSMLIPVLLGFVGLVPFLLALALTGGSVLAVARLLQKKSLDRRILIRRLVLPSSLTLGLFLFFYLVGWIPPVPLSAQNMGVYHQVEKTNGHFILSHENPWWRFWQTGDQEFWAQKGDKIYFFAKIFSPGRFDDSVIVHWYFKDPRTGWKSTDRVPMRVIGGRRDGYRGYAVKQNYTPGEWRVSLETTDQREIGRLYLTVQNADTNPERTFFQEVF